MRLATKSATGFSTQVVDTMAAGVAVNDVALAADPGAAVLVYASGYSPGATTLATVGSSVKLDPVVSGESTQPRVAVDSSGRKLVVYATSTEVRLARTCGP